MWGCLSETLAGKGYADNQKRKVAFAGEKGVQNVHLNEGEANG